MLSGHLPAWAETVEACSLAAEKYSTTHVVNEIRCDEAGEQSIRIPTLRDTALEGRKPDVLIIGGGISGASIARELSKWQLDILLVEKEADLALQASGRNDGEVHPGIDLSRGSLKHHYVRRGNAMYDQLCRELDVPFKRVGQYVCFEKAWLKPLIALYCRVRKIGMASPIPSSSPGRSCATGSPISVCLRHLQSVLRLCLSLWAYHRLCRNAVQNGAEVSLNTVVLGMEVQDGKIHSVTTNRGTVYPALVINAAGVFAEEIAAMARDRFFSIHPRRGTNSILDKKAGAYMHTIASVMDIARNTHHSKGGGILHTVHDNLLVGPDAIETWEKRTPKPTGKASTMCSKSSSAPCTPFPRGISLPTLPGCAPPPSKRTSSSKWAAKPATFCTVPVSSPQGLPLPRPSRWISKNGGRLSFHA